MRVVYKDTVVGKILDLITLARRDNKEIYYIEVTQDEYNKLIMEYGTPTCSIHLSSFGATVDGVKVRLLQGGYLVSGAQPSYTRSPYGRFEGR